MVPVIKALDVYDVQQARISASLSWLIYRYYGKEVPAELCSPCYTDQYEQEHVKPAAIALLLSADIYCRAYRRALPHDSSPPRDNAGLLLMLARKGLAPTNQGEPVKTSDLREKPIRMAAHLALIDSLMTLYSIHCTAPLPPDAEISLTSVETKLLDWIDKVNNHLLDEAEREQGKKQMSAPEGQNQAGCPSRWYWKLVPHAIAFCLKESGNKPPVIRYRKDKALSRQTPCFTAVSSLRDLSNGSALAATVHYYCPAQLRLQDICLKDTMSVADSLYNLQLLREFYAQHLPPSCPLSLEDLLYVPSALKVNLVALLADLYLCFEVAKPDFVQPKDVYLHSESATPSSAHSGGSPVFNFNRPGNTGSLPHSSSMSHMEGFGKAWVKNPLSHPLSQAVSFSIPFGLDSDVDIVMGNPVNIMRSVSSDSLNPPAFPPKSPSCVSRATYTPPEDAAELRTLKKVPGKVTSDLNSQDKTAGSPGVQSDLPTIEEALQIIHSSEARHLPDGAPDGFYLHSPEEAKPPKVEELVVTPNVGVYRTHNASRRLSRDDDSVLRDNSLDSDAEETKPAQDSSRSSLSSQADSSTGPGTKMTSFAEKKKKINAKATPEGSPSSLPLNSPNTTTWAQKAEESPVKSPALNSEMNQLSARLEEKRKAIEAQKKRIEAIFAKHRQRLGKSAFLQLNKKDGEEGEVEEGKLSPDEGLPKELDDEGRRKQFSEDENNDEKSDVVMRPRVEKQVSFSPDVAKEGLDNNLGDYNRAVAKLNNALSSLQSDMKRLSDQQDKMMKKESKAWVIPAPKASPPPHRPKSSPPVRLTREIQAPRSSLPASPSHSPSRFVPKSPQPNARRSYQPVPITPKSPKTNRPVELKLPPVNRVLTLPHNVDTIPHLRKFSPSKVPDQTKTSIYVTHKGLEGEEDGETVPAVEGHGNMRPVASVVPQSSGVAPWTEETESKRSSLIEIPLSDLRAAEDSETEGPDSLEGTPGEDELQRGGVGFFFKGEERTEDEMAQRRAALLEKQQKRTEEAKKRKQWQEEEKEKKEEASRQQQQQEEQKRKEEEVVARRGDFTRKEYERRLQLKIMEDLDKVLRQKPMTVRAVKKPRPKTVFRDDSVISRSPVRGLLGSKLSKVYSQSTMSLSTVGNESGFSTMKKSPKSPRAMSPCGPMSPIKGTFAQNGDKDWDAASTASSPASIPEYTGPRLYKEPSAKSNKFIIHNALSHCCLAGKVNESQKIKVLEDMEKSPANHFLILFRDNSCQFRAVYAFSAETEELSRLAGIGPRTISLAMIEDIYKYSSDRKRFTQIPSKTMSMSVDAFTIQGHHWQSKRPTTPKKAGTPK
ncbi:calmodulin-regulated spectrin-associated protein 3 isoform X2 [Xenopus tropicalis]|uniref:Calmodulin-regulated spectrin-associated protein 3 isoform X2 n=1 Tax=Xenopus tropicalis TaxID=8364 RepID=A0A8J1JDU3_XENTR|nr:calmodulin-regulated spectrin-associated protein 3 isoform X2 [Xenopus tropicalis]